MFGIKLDILYILTLACKMVVGKWLGQKAVGGFDWLVVRFFIKYPRELIIWEHYKKKRKGLGHQHPNPVVCNDGQCAAI